MTAGYSVGGLEAGEADAALVGVELHEHDRVQVERQDPVRRLDLGPAAPALHVFPEVLVALLREAEADCLPSDEADLDAPLLFVSRHCASSVPFGGLNQLGQDPARGGGVQERHAAVPDPAARLVVDQPQPAGTALLECLRDVRAAIGGVMEAGTALRDKSTDWRLVTERVKQLDVGIADAHEGGLDPLLRDRLAMLEGHAEPR